VARASGVLRVFVETELSLGEPNVDEGLVTWFDVRVTAGEGADSAVIANARVARIHVGEASNLGEPLYHVLDADSGGLEALYDVFFEEDWFREQFTMGAGSDLLFVSQLDLKPGWEGRNIDLALVRRLCDTIGEGCELAVMPYESEPEIAHWQRLGFILTTPERQVGYLHLSLGTKTPRIIAIDSDFGSYRVEDPQEDPDSD